MTDKNTLQFRLKIRCKRNRKAPADTTNTDELYLNSKVYTRNIEWEPLGDQKDWLPGKILQTSVIPGSRGYQRNIELLLIRGPRNTEVPTVLPQKYGLHVRDDLRDI